jgi:hypothetical protein
VASASLKVTFSRITDPHVFQVEALGWYLKPRPITVLTATIDPMDGCRK